MPNLNELAKAKLLEMQNLLGEKATKKVTEAAEKREAAAQAAGVDFKAKKTEKSDEKTVAKTKDAEAVKSKPKLSEMLAQVEAALEAGDVEDDVTEAEVGVDEPSEDEAKEYEKATRTAIKEIVSEVFDAKFESFLTKLALKEKESDPKVAAVAAQVKATEDSLVKQKAQLDELLGVQPKNAPYRATQDDKTVVKDDQKIAGPGPDPLAEFVNGFMMGGQRE